MAARDFIPKEHGAWAMLLQASILAVLLGPAVRAEHAILVATAAAVFIARAPVSAAMSRRAGDRRVVAWAGVLLCGATTGAAALVSRIPMTLVIAAGVVAALVAVFNIRRAERSTAAEVTAMLGFTLLVPIGVALAGGDWLRRGVPAGTLTFLFFVASIPHVRAMVQIRKGAHTDAARRARRISAIFAVVVVSAAVAAFAAALQRASVILAGGIAFARPVFSSTVVLRDKPVAIRTVGLVELALSTGFIIVVLLGERL